MISLYRHTLYIWERKQKFDVKLVCSVTAGQNKQLSAAKNTAKLDRETEELHHEHVGLDVCKLIQQGRQAKGLTQKDLAQVLWGETLFSLGGGDFSWM